MQKNENIEKEYEHNLHGAPPATFIDVDDPFLRARNRGAVLANIYESHVSTVVKTAKGEWEVITPENAYLHIDKRKSSVLLANDFAMCTREMDRYLSLIPQHEHGDARKEMMVHLERRGYGA